MTYIKFTTSIQTSETISFNDTPEITLQQELNTGDAAGWEGQASRLVDSRTFLAPLSGDGPDPLLPTDAHVRHISITCLPESEAAAVLTFDDVVIAILPGGLTMNFVAVSDVEDQALYGIYSNSTTDNAIVRLITDSYDTL